MKKLVLMVFIVACSANANCQLQDYNVYHKYINKAEELFFIKKNVDSCIYYYNKAFQEFEFVFAKDVVNAIQIAYYCNKPYKAYLIKGFENGVKIEHLKNILILKPIYDSLSSDSVLMKIYQRKRKEYLAKVDFAYLRKIYDMAIQDQIDKRLESREYDKIKRYTINEIRHKIKEKGFPGAKIIGIGDSHIFREIGKPQYDFNQRKITFSEKLSYYTVDDEGLTSKFILIILIHNQCSFIELKSELKKAIVKGEIHPREVGLLYDNMFRRRVNSKEYRCYIPRPEEGIFLLNLFTDYKNIRYSRKTVDKTRKKWNIVSLSIDEKKREFEKKYGFKLFWGQWESL